MGDVEVTLMHFYDDLAYTVTSTPQDVEDRVPVLRIRRIGGAGDRDNDYPRVSVQAFATPTQAHPRAHFDLAAEVEHKMLQLAEYGPQLVKGTGVVLEVPAGSFKDSGPVELPYPNPAVRVTETVYRLVVRR